eukprot:TRINITY_DN1938_c0_g1_i1.p1 TRINITY_DN1938_c0_g1~~TRINITY_DN1938_c0_g1_i1.p1  ORF type:complete len:340 (-),score=45.40 TRINITY_DN1938_c0_g1_i1:87-1106(-)
MIFSNDLFFLILSDHWSFHTSQGLISADQTNQTDAQPLWWDIENITTQDTCLLQDFLSLHELTGKDIVKNRVREKWEYHTHYLFMIVHEVYLADAGKTIKFYPLKVLLFKNLMVTIHPRRIPGARNVMQKIYKESQAIPAIEWCLSAVLHTIGKDLQKQVSILSLAVNDIDSLIAKQDEIEKHPTSLLIRFKTTHILVSTIFYMVAEKETCTETLCRGDRRYIPDSVQIYLRSLLHRYANMRTSLQVQKEILENAEHNFLAATSLRQARLELRNSQNVKVLTSVGTVFLPGILISGLFSMNVKIPYQDSGSLWPFFIILTGMITVLAFLGYYFRRNSYL